MAKVKGRIIDHFYGGIQRDEKSRIDGGALNIEEIDIFENANFVRASQKMSIDVGTGENAYSDGVVRFVGSVEGMEETGAEVTLDLTALTGGLATAPREGDVVLLAFSYVHTGSYVDLGDLEPTTTGYTELDELKKSGSLYHNTSYVGYKFMTSTPDTTVVVPSNPQTGSATAVIAYVLRNVNSAVAVTSVSAVGDGSSIPNPPEITPTAVGTTVVVVGTTTRTFRSGLGDYLVAPPSGYDNFATIDGLVSDGVIRPSTHVGIAMKAWETGAEDPSAFSVYSNSSSSSSAWGAMSIALVPIEGTEINAYTGDNADNVWGYGIGDSDEVTIFKLTNGGSDTPGSFARQLASADTTNLAFAGSPIAYHQTIEASNPNSIYYLKKASTSVYLVRYNIGADEEQRWNGSAWTATGALDSNSQLTGLNGTFDRYFMRVEFGELFISNGNKIAKVDNEGAVDMSAFTLPTGWEAVDMTFVSDMGLILARHVNRLTNFCKAFGWDLTSTTQFDYAMNIPHGGPQWIVNFKERIYALCAQNGVARFYASQASPGVPLLQIPGMELKNVANETSTQVISSEKMLSTKDNVLFFGLNKTDKTGIYAIGTLDEDKPTALILAKRFDTTDYSKHVPVALYTQGPNFFASYVDNGTFRHSRCESNNNPDRSSQAVYESLILDEGDSTKIKDMLSVYVMTKPLVALTRVETSLSADYGAYVPVYQEDVTNFDIGGSLLGNFRAKSTSGKVHQIKVELKSSGSTSPFLTGIAYLVRVQDTPAYG